MSQQSQSQSQSQSPSQSPSQMSAAASAVSAALGGTLKGGGNPQQQRFQSLVQQNPQMVAALVAQLAQQNPQVNILFVFLFNECIMALIHND